MTLTTKRLLKYYYMPDAVFILYLKKILETAFSTHNFLFLQTDEIEKIKNTNLIDHTKLTFLIFMFNIVKCYCIDVKNNIYTSNHIFNIKRILSILLKIFLIKNKLKIVTANEMTKNLKYISSGSNADTYMYDENNVLKIRHLISFDNNSINQYTNENYFFMGYAIVSIILSKLCFSNVTNNIQFIGFCFDNGLPCLVYKEKFIHFNNTHRNETFLKCLLKGSVFKNYNITNVSRYTIFYNNKFIIYDCGLDNVAIIDLYNFIFNDISIYYKNNKFINILSKNIKIDCNDLVKNIFKNLKLAKYS